MNNTPNPAKTLLALFKHLEHGTPIDGESTDALLKAIRHAGTSGDTLDEALGLRRAGRFNSLQSRLAKVRRDGFLCDAVNAYPGQGSDWHRCQCIAREIPRFEFKWKAHRYASRPPVDWPAWERWLWWAKSCDLDLPTSARGLLDIVKDSTTCNPRWESEKMLASKLHEVPGEKSNPDRADQPAIN